MHCHPPIARLVYKMSAEAGDGPKQDNNNVPNQAKNWNEALDKYDSPNSAVVWIAWLLGQLVVSVLLLILSGFHFGLDNMRFV